MLWVKEYFPISSDSSDSVDLGVSISFENRFLQVVSFSMKHRKQKMWKFINCTLKDIMSTKTMNQLISGYRFLLRTDFLQVVSFSMKHQKQKMWKFINCTLKDIMPTKTMKELCVSRRLSLFLGAGYLPVRVICWKFFFVIAKIDWSGLSSARDGNYGNKNVLDIMRYRRSFAAWKI